MTGDARRPWTADAELSAEDAAARIAAQFPEFRAPTIELLGRGWDNVAYLVDGRFVFRFPRREMGALCMRNEIASLPWIGAALPASLGVSVPAITHVGTPDEASPYPFAGYEWIAGRTGCSVEWSDPARARCAGSLAAFLAALHGMEVPSDAPEDPAGDKDVALLVAKTIAALGRVQALVEQARSAVSEACESHGADAQLAAGRRLLPAVETARKQALALASTADWSGEPRWVHGDLYARHLLVDATQHLCGVIDWGDVHAGETADDLSIAYAFLPPAARPEFFAAYGDVDEATRDRARLYALHSGAVMSAYGSEIRDEVVVRMGQAALEFAAT